MAKRLGRIARLDKRITVRAQWLLASVAGVAFVLWLVLLAPRLLVPPASDGSLQDVTDPAKRHELRDNRLKLQNDARTTLLQGLGGLALFTGAFFAYRQVQMGRRQLEHSIESSRQQHELDRQGQVTERFTRAIDQVGDQNLDVRLGGIYALERIANDSPQDRAAITDVLTAYIRGHAPWPSHDQSGEDSSAEDDQSLQLRAADVQAALTVLARRKPPIGPAQRLDLRATDLRRADLREAPLQEANLARAQLRWADLYGADLQEADLYGANLQWADLRFAQLQKADLGEAQLQGARLQSAQLQQANLEEAKLGRAVLMQAGLQGANLRFAEFQRANLKGAELRGVDLFRAQLQDANLGGAKLQGQVLSARISWARSSSVPSCKERGATLRRSGRMGSTGRRPGSGW